MTDTLRTTTASAKPINNLRNGLLGWFQPRSTNRDDAFRERTIRIITSLSLVVIGWGVFASIFIFHNPWELISFPTVQLALLILFGISAYAITQGEITLSSRLLVAGIFVGAIGFQLLARQSGNVEIYLTGIPMFMIPTLGSALLLSRQTILPTSIASIILYVIIESQLPVDLGSTTIDSFSFISSAAILIIGVGMIAYQLRTEFDNRLSALREAIKQEEVAREQAEVDRQRAERADRAKSQFLANMSHELRTPLNAIIGYDEAMLGGMAGSFTPQQIRLLGNIQHNSRRLLALINDILDLSKIEAGALQVFNAPMSPRKLLTETVDDLQSLAQQKHISLEVNVSDNVPELIMSDSKKIQQIVVNLVSNAVKFTSQGGVTVDVDTTDNTRWQIIVRDTGVGIPPHEQELVFEPFHQGDSSDTRLHKGTGLGLAIVKRLVESLNGTIELISTTGKGSMFTVVLPRVSIPEPEPVAPSLTVQSTVTETPARE